MGLEEFWFVLIAVLWGGYFLLEGFDFGVGMLLPVLPRDERERGLMFESIGPVWDGNEVWLVVAGGATFAAFPAWYATMFSGFYIALLLILVLLIVRVVSFEWREKHDTRRWRATWLWANTIGSVGAAFIWGVALANLVHGVPLDSSHVFTGDFLEPVQRLHGRRGTRGGGRLRGPRSDLPDAAAVRRLLRTGGRDGQAPVAARRDPRHRDRRLDRRRRPRSQQPGHPPDGRPRGADRGRADPGRRAHSCPPQRLGLRGDGPGRDRLRRDDLHRPVSARARLAPGRSTTASRSPTPRPGTTRSR